MTEYKAKTFDSDGFELFESSGKLYLKAVRDEGSFDKVELFLHDDNQNTLTALRIDCVELFKSFSHTFRNYDLYELDRGSLDARSRPSANLATESIPAEDETTESLFLKPESHDLRDVYELVNNTDIGAEHWKRFKKMRADFEFENTVGNTPKAHAYKSLNFESFVKEIKTFEKLRENVRELLNALELIFKQQNEAISKTKKILSDRELKKLNQDEDLPPSYKPDSFEAKYARTFKQIFREAGLLGRRGK